ncbi:capsid scaffolding serine peptidase GPO [Agrobacterium vitis]|nr:capsid scaffolding serine peptidase GPO [Agrobacterium vitis]
MSNSTYGPIEIFRAGTFQPMAGAQATITERDLQQIADNYDPVNYPAPIVIGHPAIDAPAYGWVDKLYVEGGKLKATVKEVVTQFADMVKEGRYRKVSISMFTPENTANPKPGEVYLKHVGFLGAAAPAVPGLKPVQFSNGDVDTLCFTQDAAHATQSFAQQQELTLLRREVAAQKVEKLVNDGKVLPALRDEVLEFAASLDDRETLNFADTGETT